MIPVLTAGAGGGLSEALGNMSTVLTSVVSIITGNAVLFTMFAGGLLAVGAKVFKKIKNASNSGN